ncbi:neurite extension and migration factor [Denticeps clupeoides]|uniref:DUF4683 domain-containing protein n=1 Tax=Denticeps clupeoides TaxID=299321 RepID=A0AAY4D9S5_9TELE|nr:neurite extension and migration factor [Denticeps clupeoides]
MEPAGISALGEDCLMQPSRTCLSCFIETKDAGDAEPGVSLKMADANGADFDPCPIADMSMQCMSTGEAEGYGDQLLSNQLLSFPMPKPESMEKKADADAEKTDTDTEDATDKNLYEGLLLDKCNGEEALLTNTNQDWGYFESFISESKMELLDLCSKNELSVNLFSEEDVDNYMFDDEDDDSTLSSDVCSLKIRYESFQDNMREKTNVLQEETQFNFFPSLLVNCAKKDGAVVKKAGEELQPKPEELSLPECETKRERDESGEDKSPDYSSKMNYFLDSSNSTEDSGEYSDDSSCASFSFEPLQGGELRRSKKNGGSSNHLNYGLRAKRKVRYSEDYLYDVDSIDNEKNAEKREKPPAGPKKEEDDDWCPKKRRKSSRKEPPVIIKYIIINRFKGEKHMSVKLGKIDPAATTVSLDADTMSKYEKLAPLKHFWQERQREREEQLKLALGDKCHFHPNGRHRPFSSCLPKRKYKLANRFRIQRIHTVQQSPSGQDAALSEGATRGDAAAAGRPLMVVSPNHAAALHVSDITSSRSSLQDNGERRIGNKIVRIRKFKSEARLRSKKLRALEEAGGIVAGAAEDCALLHNKDSAGSEAKAEGGSGACGNPDNNAEKFAFISGNCSSEKAAASEEVAAGVPVIPGGYLQTLLDASDSSSSTGISYFSQQPRRQYSLGLPLEEKPFATLQLAQSCVLSPPSESELQQSPQNCSSFTQIWHSQRCHNQQFVGDIPEAPILPDSFPATVAAPLPADNLAVSGYSEVNIEDSRMLYEKNFIADQSLPADADYQVCQAVCADEQMQFQRGTLNTDNGRLTSFDSVGSLSAASSSYSSVSLKSCEKEGEEDTGENFLAHCSPKLVIQQSIEAITPLRESTDLLDISNFTPDKFRHTSLSELSPPETPNLSPQVMAREITIACQAQEYQDGSELNLDATNPDMKWHCNIMDCQDGLTPYAVDPFQLHTLNDDDGRSSIGLDNKDTIKDNFDEQAGKMTKGTRAKKKNCVKQGAGQSSKKSKAPKAAKSEKVKVPRQNSKKKLKAHLDDKGNKVTAPGQLTDGVVGEWPSLGWADGNNQTGDDQREFEEPSNILSNIVSGMAVVQRFMMASVEPLWGPASSVCLAPDANSLKLKTLKILAGTAPEPKKKGAASSGATKGRKSVGKGGKNQAKFNPFFPQLALGCNMFDKPNLCVPGINGPAHKKMYRHKTSAKFPRIENIKGKCGEREPSKDIALMASFEKLR